MRDPSDVLMTDEWLRTGVDALVLLVEAAGAVVIFVGALLAAVQFLRALPHRRPEEFVPVRLDMLLAAGLLRLGADAPWSSIATAATIVVLRKVVVAGIRQSTVATAAFSRSGRGSPRTRGQSQR